MFNLTLRQLLCTSFLMAMTILVAAWIGFQEGVTAGRLQMEAQTYWPSVREMQEFCGTKVDGVWGDLTKDAYIPKQEEWYCHYMAGRTGK